MPNYHVCVGAVAMPDGGTEVLSTMRPEVVEVHHWSYPIGCFWWPMDSMTRRSGDLSLDYDGMLPHLHASGRYWWLARIYKSYTGLLSMYIRFAHQDRVYHYILDYPPEHVASGVHYDSYPQPRDFYLARRAIMTKRSWTLAEYDSIGGDSIDGAGAAVTEHNGGAEVVGDGSVAAMTEENGGAAAAMDDGAVADS